MSVVLPEASLTGVWWLLKTWSVLILQIAGSFTCGSLLRSWGFKHLKVWHSLRRWLCISCDVGLLMAVLRIIYSHKNWPEEVAECSWWNLHNCALVPWSQAPVVLAPWSRRSLCCCLWYSWGISLNEQPQVPQMQFQLLQWSCAH